MPRFQTLRDWRIYHRFNPRSKAMGYLRPDTPNPYVQRILRKAGHYGWDFPFELLFRKMTPEEKEYWKEQHQKVVHQKVVEKRFLEFVFGEGKDKEKNL